jgi:hypothetical protein
MVELPTPTAGAMLGEGGHAMSEYTVMLRRTDRHEDDVPKVEVNALTEFEAAAVGLDRFRQMGEQFSGGTGVEIVQGNVRASKPVPVKDITYWLRNKPEGHAIVERDRLQSLLDYVKE